MIMVSICKVCGKRFTKYRSFQVYCSDACRAKVLGRNRSYKRTLVRKKKCEHCGKEFETNMKHKVFCSNECYIESRKDYYTPNEPRTVVCEICGKEFKTTHASKKYCSKECYDEAAYRRRCERLIKG